MLRDIVLVYLIVGVCSLYIFDIATHKIRDRFSSVATSNQIYSADIGIPTPNKVAKFLTAVFLLLEWPLPIIVHFVVSRKKENK